MLHSIYDLTTQCRKTTGDVPAKLVGASTTVVGSKMYLFGGRLVTERRMVSDLYVFDLETFHWEKIQAFPEDDIPKPRYFHSADAWNNQLIIFGGMSNQPDSPNPDELCVLNDVRFFDLNTRHWLPTSQFPAVASDAFIPRARYAHLSSVTSDQLFIIGGQDFFNTWLDDICVYDLLAKTWVERRDYPRHCGTYRSVAVSSNLRVRLPQEEARSSQASARFRDTPTPTADSTPTESLIHLPYSAAPTEDYPSDIYLYSNYNFTDVKRELEVFSPLPDTDFTIEDRSSAMNGATFPPGLRFPTGAILGTHLIIAGTYLAHSYQSFSIWVLDLITMTWSRIDPGKAVETGSWFRGCLWAESNKFLIFGNRNGNLVDDYNRRLLSWDHVAVVDLEAFGIYQPPPLKLDIRMQEMGLAALEDNLLVDFEIICDDDRRINCSRKLLDDRWPWFREQRQKMLRTAQITSESLPNSPMHVKPPGESPNTDDQRPDPRLTPRTLHLSEPYAITMALLQYFYSMSLITPLQHAPAVLSQLLVLSVNYQLTHLESLVKHAMHRALSNSTSVGVYEVATLCGCRSLQIRALKTVMSYTQKRPNRRDKDGGGRPPPDGGSHGGGSNGTDGHSGSGNDKYTSRPRGTSDARWRTNTVEPSANNHVYNMGRKHNTHHQRHAPASTSESEDDQTSPLPLFTRPRRSPSKRESRPLSTVSVATDEEIHSIAAMMETAFVEEPSNRPKHDRAKSYDLHEAVLDPSIPPLESESDNMSDGYAASIGSSNRWSNQGSLNGPTEFELLSSSGEVTRVYLPPTPTYPSFHLPSRQSRQQSYPGYADTSDTPSLMSSTSRSSYGSLHAPPISPGIMTPVEFSDSAPLPAIEERQPEGHEWENDWPGHGPVAITTEEPHSPWPKQKSNIEWTVDDTTTIKDSRTEDPKQGRLLLSPIVLPPAKPSAIAVSSESETSPVTFSPSRKFSASPSPITPPLSPVLPLPMSPSQMSPSIASPPLLSPSLSSVTYKSQSTSSFSRFLKKKEFLKSTDDAVYDARGTKTQGKLDAKAVKAQEKKWKKEVAKAKTENLAIQLKENARKREQAVNDALSTRSSERKRRENDAAMWGGMMGMTM